MDKESKVIIIGNSPKVLENEYGSIIDSHDVVIRINKCVIEDYIGSKIDIWATSHNYDEWYGYDFIPKRFENLSHIWKRTPSTQLNSLPKYLKSIPHLQMFKSNFYRSQINKNVRNYINEAKLIAEPCTGLLTILTATTFYKNISIYGFNFYKNHLNTTKSPHYYRSEDDTKEDKIWESEKEKKFMSENQINKKFKIVQNLVDKNLIKILE